MGVTEDGVRFMGGGPYDEQVQQMPSPLPDRVAVSDQRLTLTHIESDVAEHVGTLRIGLYQREVFVDGSGRREDVYRWQGWQS